MMHGDIEGSEVAPRKPAKKKVRIASKQDKSKSKLKALSVRSVREENVDELNPIKGYDADDDHTTSKQLYNDDDSAEEYWEHLSDFEDEIIDSSDSDWLHRQYSF